MLMSTDPLLCSTECISDYLLEKQNWMHITLIHVADELHFLEFSTAATENGSNKYHPFEFLPERQRDIWQVFATTRASALRPSAPVEELSPGRGPEMSSRHILTRCHLPNFKSLTVTKHPVKNGRKGGALTQWSKWKLGHLVHKLFSHRHPLMLRLVKSSKRPKIWQQLVASWYCLLPLAPKLNSKGLEKLSPAGPMRRQVHASPNCTNHDPFHGYRLKSLMIIGPSKEDAL